MPEKKLDSAWKEMEKKELLKKADEAEAKEKEARKRFYFAKFRRILYDIVYHFVIFLMLWFVLSVWTSYSSWKHALGLTFIWVLLFFELRLQDVMKK